MKNWTQDGEVLDLLAPYAVTSGGGMKIGAIIAIAQTSAASGAAVLGDRRGIYTAAKATGQAWAVGDKLYWDDTAKVFTTTASANTLCGCAMAIAASGDTTGSVLLDGTIR